MVKRTNSIIKSEIDKLNENETKAVVNYISQLLLSRNHKQSDSQLNDDLIMSLSERPENRRARQVFEWERIRRQNAQRTA